MAGTLVNVMPFSALWRFVHPTAQAIGGVEWARIVDSPAGDFVWERLRHSPALAYLEGAERALVSSPGRASGAATVFLAAIEGSIRRDRIEAEMLFSQSSDGVELLVMPSWIVALWDERVTLVGDIDSVKAVLAGRAAPDGALVERARRVSANCDAWLLTAAPPAAFLNAGHDFSEASAAIERAETALSLRDGLTFEVRLHMPSAEAAASVAASVSGVIGIARLQHGPDWPLARAIDGFRVGAAGSSVHLELNLREPEWLAVLAALATGTEISPPVFSNQPVICRPVEPGPAGSGEGGHSGHLPGSPEGSLQPGGDIIVDLQEDAGDEDTGDVDRPEAALV